MSVSVTTPSTTNAPNAERRLRFVTAASLFDGHDAAINIMRRILQSEGCEVIHLGHDRSAADIVDAAIEEDAHGIAVSSYQGGHNEFFAYMVELLAERGRPDIKVFGGGGGTITDREIVALHEKGVECIYSVEDGRRLGLVGMIQDMMGRAAASAMPGPVSPVDVKIRDAATVGRAITALESLHESGSEDELAAIRAPLLARLADHRPPILGITGTGGAGKSSLTDELVRRAIEAFPTHHVAVLSVDPTRRRTGGALLGDRIRMNSASHEHVFMRSLATRQANASVSGAVRDALLVLQAAAYDLVILETAGIGQSGSEVVDLADLSLYVMTPEFGAPSQLEKIDMLDFADVVAINKADKRGADDARRHVGKQMQRNRGAFDKSPEDMPVFLCSASRYGDAGVDRLFAHLLTSLTEMGHSSWVGAAAMPAAPELFTILPPRRVRYLSEIADAVRGYRTQADVAAARAYRADGFARSLSAFGDAPLPGEPLTIEDDADVVWAALAVKYNESLASLSEADKATLRGWAMLVKSYTDDQNAYEVRGREIRVDNYTTSLSHTKVPKVALPNTQDWGERVRWSRLENTPGRFPYTAGVFPYKRAGEDPTRMFAGEGSPEQTNRRFHLLAQAQPAARLSTAFDSVTLYGRDP
ncbi:MAG: methylmalonyl-CoA mutase, partial [Bradymonadia bacterium]